MKPANRVQGSGLPGPLPGSLEQLESPPSVRKRPLVVAKPVENQGEYQAGVSLTGIVAEFLVQLEGFRLVRAGILVTAQAAVYRGKPTVADRLPAQVA